MGVITLLAVFSIGAGYYHLVTVSGPEYLWVAIVITAVDAVAFAGLYVLFHRVKR